MDNGIISKIRHRMTYLTEVNRLIFEILNEFVNDPMGSELYVSVGKTSIIGFAIEIGARRGESISDIWAEVNSIGEVLIWRDDKNKKLSDITNVPERRPLDFSNSPEESTIDILLLLADEHLGFVGNRLQQYLAIQCENGSKLSFRPDMQP